MAQLQLSEPDETGLALWTAGQRHIRETTIERASKKTADVLIDQLDALIGRKVAISSTVPMQIDRQDYMSLLAACRASLHVLHLHPADVPMSLIIPAELVGRLTDEYYGGCLTTHYPIRLEYSVIELMILEKFCTIVASALKNGFDTIAGQSADVVSTSFLPATRIDPPAETQFQLCPLTVHITPESGLQLDLVFPADAFDLSRRSALIDHWHEDLTKHIHAISLDVRAVLAKPQMSLHQLRQLGIGETILIDQPRTAELCVNNATFALCRPGTGGGNSAVSVTHNFLHPILQ
jgi:flagellar motor switch protein FliM